MTAKELLLRKYKTRESDLFFLILIHLAERGKDCTAAELTKATGAPASSIYCPLSTRLIPDGLVEKIEGSDLSYYKITQKGEDQLRQLLTPEKKD